jgi:guanylate kinase
MAGNLFVVVAPSGAGKTSLVNELLKRHPHIHLSISHTTRQPRDGEKTGREYHFVDKPAFEKMIDQGDFLEHANVYGNYYGTSKRWIEKELAGDHDVLLEIDWQGAQQIRTLKPDVVSIFVLPPSVRALEERLRGRGQDSAEVIARRVAAARGEMAHVDEFDYVIINDDFDRAAQDLISIIRAERHRLPRQLARHTDLISRLTDS